MQKGFILPGQMLSNQHAEDIIPNINRLIGSARAAGSPVVFLKHTTSDQPRFKQTAWQERLVPRDESGASVFQEGKSAHELHAGLDFRPSDHIVLKHRFSAFLPNSSDLDLLLKSLSIDTLIITGTATNVCCESTARDGYMIDYRIVFVSDATAAVSDEEHNASLLTMTTMFACVRTTLETVHLLQATAPARN
jgi:ureidoacrylate peracid hydrolase